MSRYIWKSVLLLTLSIVICYGLYPLSSWVIGKAALSFQPNGSMLSGHDSRIVDSRQIAEPTPKDEHFQPRPSAASYDASGSTSSAMAASNNFFHPQNSDFGVTEPPLLQRSTQKICHFYDC
jgi:potassium-transporting ATPase KdpC subunit